MNITFLGGGNMAQALIGGLLERGFSASAIRVVELKPEGRVLLEQRFGVSASAELDDAALASDVLVLAVKPQQMREALAPARGRLGQALVVSIAAGLTLAVLQRWLGGHRRIVRVMPNTPALIGAGAAGLYADPCVDAAGREAAGQILGAVGSVVWLDSEAKIDAVTALSGSGPAYVFYFIEALIEGGLSLGLDAETARNLALDTLLGATKLALASSEDAATLRERVTSKGGTTAAALDVLSSGNFKALIAKALAAANARSEELGSELGRD